jgi:uncharacterized Zn-binding protein involved in type VI secretion
MAQVARVGDPGSHGAPGIIAGVLTTGSPTAFAEGIPVSRIGDQYVCSLHGPVAMVTGSSKTLADGIGVCRVGDLAACGAAINAGSPSFSST